MRASKAIDRKAEVWRRLQTVTDPELDEPVTDLEFVTRADVDADNCVHIEFRLPTYWCAANFSFLMADDMRNAVKELPWVADISVVLGDHMYADQINAGLARGLTFQETFGAEADGDLDELRRTFLLKAFQRRQAALLAHLIEAGHHAARLVEMTLDELVVLKVDEAGARLRTRYLERRPIIADATSRAFVDAEGNPLQAETLSTYVRTLRRVDINAEFNSALCRGLLHARFDMETPLSTKDTRRFEPPRVSPQDV
ncbi:MAG TPA: iron-sulfur cluster assembly protein [Roseiarcus sp.]|jgi:metal-sulfur cluster biosynthetic enzyme